MNTTRKVITGGLMVGGLLLLAGWGGRAPPGQKPDYPGKPKVGPKGSWGWGNVPADSSGLLEGFDPGCNKILFSPDCDWVIEGNRFWQDGRGLEFPYAVSYPTVDQTLSYVPPGSDDDCVNGIEGWIDYLMDVEGIEDPIVIVQRFMQEVAPFCWDVDPSFWGEGLLAWYNNFLARVTDYVESVVGGIDFGG